MRCRFCGSTSLHTDTQHKTFSAGKAAAGAVVFGVVGAAAGFIGKEKQGYRCGACGSFMELPMDTFTGMQIDTAVQKAKKGDTTLYTYYKAQYPNIETVAAAQQAPATAPVEREISAPTEAFGQEESIKRSYRYGSWSPDAPVYVESVVLKTDGKEDRMSLVAWNQSGKEIRSLYLNVVVFDDTGDEVSRCRCVYQNMVKDEDEPKRLPVDKTFYLNTDVAYRVQIEQEKAAFADGSTWRAAEADKVYTLPEQPVLTEKNFPRIQYVQSKYFFMKFRPLRGQLKPTIRLNMPIQEEKFWMCDCGHPAKNDEPCPYCHNEYWALEKLYSQQTLLAGQQKAVRTRAEERTKKMLPKYEQLVEAKETAEKDAKYRSALRLMQSHLTSDVQKAKSMLADLAGWRDADAIIENCDKKIEQIKEQQSKEKKEAERRAAEEAKRQEEERIAKEKAAKTHKTVLAIIIPILVIGIIAVIVWQAVIIPKQKLDQAMELLQKEQYEFAYLLLEEIHREDIISSNKHERAICLIQDGNYDKAYALLEQIGDEETINESQYERAAGLFSKGQYEEAIEVFTSLHGYKDSIEQIFNCREAINDRKYSTADELVKQKQYDEAISILNSLNGYKDSADKANNIFLKYKLPLFQKANVGDYITFGTYEQDNDFTNGTETIEWLVLAKEDNRILVISKYALDYQHYGSQKQVYNYATNGKYTYEKGYTWDVSFVRQWLNEDFYNAAFTSYEKSRIPTTTVVMDHYGWNSGDDTEDKVFLLSVAEVKELFGSDVDRQCQGTPYVYSQLTYFSYPDTLSWLLRTPVNEYKTEIGKYAVAFVATDGSIPRFSLGIFVHYVENESPVRPAMWIDLSVGE